MRVRGSGGRLERPTSIYCTASATVHCEGGMLRWKKDTQLSPLVSTIDGQPGEATAEAREGKSRVVTDLTVVQRTFPHRNRNQARQSMPCSPFKSSAQTRHKRLYLNITQQAMPCHRTRRIGWCSPHLAYFTSARGFFAPHAHLKFTNGVVPVSSSHEELYITPNYQASKPKPTRCRL